jgi:hypothetical protein
MPTCMEPSLVGHLFVFDQKAREPGGALGVHPRPRFEHVGVSANSAAHRVMAAPRGGKSETPL